MVRFLGVTPTQVIADAVGTTKTQEPVSADDIDGRWEKIAYALNSLNKKDKMIVVELVERVFQLMK